MNFIDAVLKIFGRVTGIKITIEESTSEEVEKIEKFWKEWEEYLS